MKAKISLILFLIIFSRTSIYAQESKVVPSSPEAAALAKMINYPINMNTGVPDISIPLYSIETGGLKLPIALNYHAGGFRINERATSVGLGWSLSCDIQITRSINGKDDFSSNGYLDNTKMKTYYSSNACSNCEYPLGVDMNSYAIASGAVDGMPDRFDYKLLNKAGSFYFRKTSSGTSYTIVPVPYDNIKIQYNQGQFIIIDTDGTAYTFGTSGPPGNIPNEVFGVERSGSGYPQPDYISAWKCKKIENATKTESIQFTYRAKSQIQFTSASDYIEYYANENRCTGFFSPYSYNTFDLGNYPTVQQLFSAHSFSELLSPRYIQLNVGKSAILTIPYVNQGNLLSSKTYDLTNQDVSISSHSSSAYVDGLAIESIKFREGTLTFSGSDELNSISVQNLANEEIKLFKFFQSYAKPVNETYAKNRNGYSFNGTRYLDSIHVKATNNTYQKYSLLYNSKFCFGSHLTGQDAWGYVNASTNEINPYSSSPLSVPSNEISTNVDKMGGGCYPFSNTLTIGGSALAEAPDKTRMKEGILSRIVYPTGGFVNFDFEPNKYNEYLFTYVQKQAVRMGGGLRINSINYYDGTSRKPSLQKYYRYGELEDGIGVLINRPPRNFKTNNYEAFQYSQDVVTYTVTPKDASGFSCPDGCLTLFTKEKLTTYLPASSLDYSYPTGAPIYYTTVNEYQSDLGTYTGKTVHEFYPPGKFQPNYNANQNNFITGTNIQMIHAAGLMGAQKSIKDYKSNNGKFSLVHSREFEYTKYQQPEEIRAVAAFFKVIYQTRGAYYEREKLYREPGTSGTPQSRYQDYTAVQYGIPVGKLLMSIEKEKWVKGTDTLVQNTEYQYDNNSYLQPSRIITKNGLGHLITKGIKYAYDFTGQIPYDAMVVKNIISPSIEETITNSAYAKELSKTRTNYGQINAGSGFIVPVSVQKSVQGNALETELSFDLYDQYANPVEISGKDKVKKVYLWGYGYKYPIAEIIGSSFGAVSSLVDVASLQLNRDDLSIKSTLNTLRNSLPDAMMSSFTYKPLFGMTSKTEPNGKTGYFEYDPFGRLSTIKDHSGFILSKYDYRETGPVSAEAFTAFTANNPIMVSMRKYCPPYETYLPSNRISFGGSHVAGSNLENSNANAEDLVKGGYQPFIEVGGDCSEITESVPITLKAFMFNGLATPYRVYLELLQDNSLLASREFPSSSTESTQFNIKQGKYIVSMRHILSTKESNLTYSIQPSTGPSFSALPGDTVTFVAGLSYQITISNAY